MKEELSPITGKRMSLVSEKDSVVFRGEEYDYLHFSFRCNDSGEQFTTTELDRVNAGQVYNAYRQRHSFPFPDEIALLRKHYGVSASMMSQIMGFGVNQWRYYEADKVPSESNARAIMAIRHKDIFLEYLEAAKNAIGDAAYRRIRERIESTADYVKPAPVSENSGYVSFSLTKITEIIKFFITSIDRVFVTKMNKLLFYSDFLKYQRDGYGMTGLEYRAIQYGPVPNGYGEIYSRAQGIAMEDYIYPDGMSGQLLKSKYKPDMTVFSQREVEVLSEVLSRFKNATAGQISDASHKEKGWQICSRTHEIIPYSYAFDIDFDACK